MAAPSPAYLANVRPAEFEEVSDVRFNTGEQCSDKAKQLAKLEPKHEQVMRNPHRSIIFCAVRDLRLQPRKRGERPVYKASVDHFRQSTPVQGSLAGSMDPATATTTVGFGASNGLGKEQVLVPLGITVDAEKTNNNNGVGRLLKKGKVPMNNTTGVHLDVRDIVVLDVLSEDDIKNDPNLRERIYPEMRSTGVLIFVLAKKEFLMSEVMELAIKNQHSNIRHYGLRRYAKNLKIYEIAQKAMNDPAPDVRMNAILELSHAGQLLAVYAQQIEIGEVVTSAPPGDLVYIDLRIK
jgi:hypothetical protein